jgi:hypothetical protein
MTRGDLKTSRTGSRTPFQILADYYQTSDARDPQLWDEYARTTRGLRIAMLGPSASTGKNRPGTCRGRH